MTTRSGALHPEPEYRLPAMIFPAIIGPWAFYFWIGDCKSETLDWCCGRFWHVGIWSYAASNVVVTYAVDAYRLVCSIYSTLNPFAILFLI